MQLQVEGVEDLTLEQQLENSQRQTDQAQAALSTIDFTLSFNSISLYPSL